MQIRTVLRYLSLLLLLFFIYTCSNGFSSLPLNSNSIIFKIEGIVTDASGNGIENVLVYTSRLSKQVVTATDGTFTIENVPSGEQILIASKEGYIFFNEKGNDEFSVYENLNGIAITGYSLESVYEGFNGDYLKIGTIQGEGHYSPYKNAYITNVFGIVTATRAFAYETSMTGRGTYIREIFMTSPFGDSNIKTSDGIKVLTSDKAVVKAGDLICVKYGIVEETNLNKGVGGSYYADNLTKTQIKCSYDEGDLVILASNKTLPPAVLIGKDGRIPPDKEFASDNFSSYDVSKYGLDFFESLESMRVTVQSPIVTGHTSNVVYSSDYAIKEMYIIADTGTKRDNTSVRGGLKIGEDYTDFNPEIITLAKFAIDLPDYSTGAKFNGDITGVIDYSFKKFKLLPVEQLPKAVESYYTRDVSPVTKSPGKLIIASFNVENYTVDSAKEGDSTGVKTLKIAQAIVNHLQLPDIIGLIEVQDNSGSENDGVNDCNLVLDQLITVIDRLTGQNKTYQYRYINPIYDTEGGAPGGNIRNVLLYNPLRVTFVDSPSAEYVRSNQQYRDGLSYTPVEIVHTENGPSLSHNPGRIAPLDPAFDRTRKSLVGEFIFNGEKEFVIVNHFNAKGGDNALQGNVQPPVRGSEEKRTEQAVIVKQFADKLLAADKNANIVILGDFNDFHFSESLQCLHKDGLYNLVYDIPVERRYTYNYEGNSQILDNIIVSENMRAKKPEIDAVKINADFHFNEQAADHDPLISGFTFFTQHDDAFTGGLEELYPKITPDSKKALFIAKSLGQGRLYYSAVLSTETRGMSLQELKNGYRNDLSPLNRQIIYLIPGSELTGVIDKLTTETAYKFYYGFESSNGIFTGGLKQQLFTTTSGSKINFAFENSDLEVDIHSTSYALKPSETSYVDGFGIAESRCLHIAGSESANFFVFSSREKLFPKSDYTQLSFYIKGESLQKSLVILLGSSSDGNIFNLKQFDKNRTISKSSSASYTGYIKCDDWTKVTLDISTVAQTENFTLSIKGGSDAVYDLYIDNFELGN